MQNIKVSEIMTKNLMTVKATDTFEVVEQIFNEHTFHHLPVTDESGKLIGLLSKSDFLTLSDSFSVFRKQMAVAQNKRVFAAFLVGDIMQKKVAKLKPDATLETAAAYFKENLFHALPIVDEQCKLLGMVTTFDLLNVAFA